MATKKEPEVPKRPEPLDLKSFEKSEDGKAIVELANKLREAVAKAGMPMTVVIAGVAPFAQHLLDQHRAEGFAEGRQYERLQTKYAGMIGSQPA